jgi:peptidoglycan/LPS O-acetylase OafA/YrhL
MKMFATILIVLGLATMALNIGFVEKLETKNAVALILGGMAVIIGVFARSRAKAGIGVIEITEKDKTEFNKLCSELNPRRLLGRLIGTFGALLIFTGVFWPIYADSTHKWDWGAAMGTMAFGIFLVFCATLLENSAVLRNRPPTWFPAVSGFACSCCMIAAVICVAVIWRSSPDGPPTWVRSALALSLVVGVLSAIICVLTGIAAVVRRKVNPPSEIQRSADSSAANPP